MSYPIVIPVRDGFSEQDVWRAALGPFEPLHVVGHKCDALDAPQWLPLGATRWCSYGRTAVVLKVNREPSRWD
jgi:hypothetical protein